MTHTVRSKWRFISDRSSLCGLTLVAPYTTGCPQRVRKHEGTTSRSDEHAPSALDGH